MYTHFKEASTLAHVRTRDLGMKIGLYWYPSGTAFSETCRFVIFRGPPRHCSIPLQVSMDEFDSRSPWMEDDFEFTSPSFLGATSNVDHSAPLVDPVFMESLYVQQASSGVFFVAIFPDVSLNVFSVSLQWLRWWVCQRR